MSHLEGRPNGAADDFRAELIKVLPRLRALSRMLTRDHDQADDLVHNVLVRALSAQDRYQPGTNLAAWLFVILRNRHVSTLRRKSKTASLDDLPAHAPSTPAGQVAAVEIRELRHVLQVLPPQQREALVLVAAAGFSHAAAAKACRCAVGTVKSRMNRARAELRRLLDPPPDSRNPAPADNPRAKHRSGHSTRTARQTAVI